MDNSTYSLLDLLVFIYCILVELLCHRLLHYVIHIKPISAAFGTSHLKLTVIVTWSAHLCTSQTVHAELDECTRAVSSVKRLSALSGQMKVCCLTIWCDNWTVYHNMENADLQVCCKGEKKSFTEQKPSSQYVTFLCPHKHFHCVVRFYSTVSVCLQVVGFFCSVCIVKIGEIVCWIWNAFVSLHVSSWAGVHRTLMGQCVEVLIRHYGKHTL